MIMDVEALGYEYNGIPLYCAKSMSSGSAAISKCERGTLIGGGKCYIISVDPDIYYNISEKAREFFLLHEISHIMSGHLDLSDNKIRMYNILRYFGYCPLEWEADSIACEKLNCSGLDVKRFLKECDKVLRKNTKYHLSKLDQISRYFHLSKTAKHKAIV